MDLGQLIMLWLISPIEYIQEACEKAFDTVNHIMLLDKLAHCGVRKTEKDWFKTYLTNRKQHIVVNGQTSDSALIEF